MRYTHRDTLYAHFTKAETAGKIFVHQRAYLDALYSLRQSALAAAVKLTHDHIKQIHAAGDPPGDTNSTIATEIRPLVTRDPDTLVPIISDKFQFEIDKAENRLGSYHANNPAPVVPDYDDD